MGVTRHPQMWASPALVHSSALLLTCFQSLTPPELDFPSVPGWWLHPPRFWKFQHTPWIKCFHRKPSLDCTFSTSDGLIKGLFWKKKSGHDEITTTYQYVWDWDIIKIFEKTSYPTLSTHAHPMWLHLHTKKQQFCFFILNFKVKMISLTFQTFFLKETLSKSHLFFSLILKKRKIFLMDA